MTTGTDYDRKTPPRLDEPTTCWRCGEPLKCYLADYQRFAHIRCLLQRVEGWAPSKGRPHYVW